MNLPKVELHRCQNSVGCFLFVETDAATFEINTTNNSQDIMKKQNQQQLTVPPHKKLQSATLFLKRF